MKASVLLPVYNGEKYLREAVESILSQTLDAFELLVIDDGSTDHTGEILMSFADSRLNIVTNEQNRGVAFSLNRALSKAQGEFILRMDGDDIAYPNRLEKQVRFLEKHPEIDFCGSSVKQFGVKKGVRHFPETHEEILVQHLFNPAFIHSTVCWRRKPLEKNYFRYQEEPPTAEDFELWVRVGQKHRMANIREPLIHYRIDPQIKISTYIQQQMDGAKLLRREALSFLSDDITEGELKIHHLISEGLELLSFEQIKEAVLWLNKLVLLNRKKSLYKQSAFEERCVQFLYLVYASNIHALDGSNFSELQGLSNQLSLSLTHRFKLWTKRLYCQISGRF